MVFQFATLLLDTMLFLVRMEPPTSSDTMNNTRIVIIGAGASGIAAASRLLENGIQDFIILEAEDRIGGRIHTTEFDEGVVDMGGQWVHGEKGNVVFNMADPLNLLTGTVTDIRNDTTLYVESSGTIVDKEVSLQFLKVLMEIDEDSAEDLKHFHGSVGEYFTREFERRIHEDQNEVTKNLQLAQIFLKWYQKIQNSIDGSDSWFETSGQGHTHYWECEGNLYWSWKSGGYRSVLDLLMKRYPDPSKELPVLSKTLLNKEVVKITWDNLSNDNEGKVLVDCLDGTTYRADHIVVTTSLGVLKERAHTMFNPALPEQKLIAIQGLSIGTVDKLYLKFPYRWWPEDCEGFGLLWTEVDQKAFILQNIKDDRNKSWLQGVYGFFSVDNQPRVMCGWIVGPTARQMELLSDAEVMEGLVELLDMFLGKKFNIPQPDELKRTKWTANPHFRGSYSFRSMETERFGTNASRLAEPIANSQGKTVMLFAGEATHDHYYSTVHGAIETGWREADRIISMSSHRYSGVADISEIPSYEVIIIGAGISGLAAAFTLVGGGVEDVLVLEAQNYAGGRILSLPLADNWVEAGAQWIHGENNDIWKLANKFHLLSDVTSSEGEGLYIREDGMVLEPSLVFEVHRVVMDILEECEQFVQNTCTTEVPTSIGHYLRCKFVEYLNSCHTDTNDVRMMKEELYDWHIRFQIIDNSCTVLDKLSAKAWGKYMFSGGTDYVNFKQGYSSLIKSLVNQLPAGILQLNRPVKSIKWKQCLGACDIKWRCTKQCSNSTSPDSGLTQKIDEIILVNGLDSCDITGNDDIKSSITPWTNCHVETHSQGSPTVLVCEDGSLISAQHVIVTSSLGYLKKHCRTMFEPQLPQIMTQVSNKKSGFLRYLLEGKTIVTNTPQGTSYMLQYIYVGYRKIKTIQDMGFAAINKIYLAFEEPWWDSDVKGFQLIWSQNNNTEKASTELSSWTRGLTGFDVLSHHKAVLLGWVGGKCAEQVEELSEESIGQHCTQLLRQFTQNLHIPLPYKVIRTQWHRNPYICGGYSNTSSMCDISNVGPTTLSEPVCADVTQKGSSEITKYPVILLAGEATHESYFSTTHGAYETGQRQAKEIRRTSVEKVACRGTHLYHGSPRPRWLTAEADQTRDVPGLVVSCKSPSGYLTWEVVTKSMSYNI